MQHMYRATGSCTQGSDDSTAKPSSCSPRCSAALSPTHHRTTHLILMTGSSMSSCLTAPSTWGVCASISMLRASKLNTRDMSTSWGLALCRPTKYSFMRCVRGSSGAGKRRERRGGREKIVGDTHAWFAVASTIVQCRSTAQCIQLRLLTQKKRMCHVCAACILDPPNPQTQPQTYTPPLSQSHTRHTLTDTSGSLCLSRSPVLVCSHGMIWYRLGSEGMWSPMTGRRKLSSCVV